MMAVMRVMFLSFSCFLGAVGCETIDKYAERKEKADAEKADAIDAVTAATVNESTSGDDTPATPSPTSISAGSRADGSGVDSNRETDNFGNSKIWVNGSVNLGVRCLANDEDRSGYFCDDVVSNGGGLKMLKNGDGTVTAVGSDFISSRSGLVYKFQGFKIASDANSMTRSNPKVLQKSEQTGTFRAYWGCYNK